MSHFEILPWDGKALVAESSFKVFKDKKITFHFDPPTDPLIFFRWNDANHVDALHGYLNTVNSKPWQGRDTGEVLFSSVSAIKIDDSFATAYLFSCRPNSWQEPILGYDIYKSTDFNEMGLME